MVRIGTFTGDTGISFPDDGPRLPSATIQKTQHVREETLNREHSAYNFSGHSIQMLGRDARLGLNVRI